MKCVLWPDQIVNWKEKGAQNCHGLGDPMTLVFASKPQHLACSNNSRVLLSKMTPVTHNACLPVYSVQSDYIILHSIFWFTFSWSVAYTEYLLKRQQPYVCPCFQEANHNKVLSKHLHACRVSELPMLVDLLLSDMSLNIIVFSSVEPVVGFY